MNNLQILSASLFLVSFLGLLHWMQLNPRSRLYAVPLLAWIGHSLVFYAVIWLVTIRAIEADFSYWSAALRFQGALTTCLIVIAALINCYREARGESPWI